MKNLFIVFFCLVSVLAIKANGQESLWKIQAVDYQGTYYGAAVANGGIGIRLNRNVFNKYYLF